MFAAQLLGRLKLISLMNMGHMISWAACHKSMRIALPLCTYVAILTSPPRVRTESKSS